MSEAAKTRPNSLPATCMVLGWVLFVAAIAHAISAMRLRLAETIGDIAQSGLAPIFVLAGVLGLILVQVLFTRARIWGAVLLNGVAAFGAAAGALLISG